MKLKDFKELPVWTTIDLYSFARWKTEKIILLEKRSRPQYFYATYMFRDERWFIFEIYIDCVNLEVISTKEELLDFVVSERYSFINEKKDIEKIKKGDIFYIFHNDTNYFKHRIEKRIFLAMEGNLFFLKDDKWKLYTYLMRPFIFHPDIEDLASSLLLTKDELIWALETAIEDKNKSIEKVVSLMTKRVDRWNKEITELTTERLGYETILIDLINKF